VGKIELEEVGVKGGASLKCPVCKGDYLHQSSVGVYHLAPPSGYHMEHQVIVDVTTQDVNVGYVPSGIAMNPSDRGREGMRIAFECEFDCDLPDLLIYQHKGITIIEWGDVSQLPKARIWSGV
jgi:hypothetical protein